MEVEQINPLINTVWFVMNSIIFSCLVAAKRSMVRGRLEDAGNELTHSRRIKKDDNCSMVSGERWSFSSF